MTAYYKELIKGYFDKHSLVESNVQSFNKFMDEELQKIVNETQEIIPTIIPAEIKDFKIKLGKIRVEKPSIVEADGSKRDVYPVEARLRSLTYSTPIYLGISTFVDGVERESFNALIGKMPVMLKSKYCHLSGLDKKSLAEHYEDPYDPGGYFILNGNERVLITVEDLASNKLFIEKTKTGPSKYVAKIFSEKGSYRIPHSIEQMRNGIIYLSFTRFKRVPITAVIKALGITVDQEISEMISKDKQYDDIFINLYETKDLKTQKDALEYIGKKVGMTQSPEEKIEKSTDLLDKYLLPHLGIKPEDRLYKAYNLCKYIKRFLMVTREGASLRDKDHYMDKKLKLSGDLLGDLFRINLRSLVQDMLYNFQRLVKRGKFQSIRIIIRDQLLTSRIKSAMATGSWVGGRKGISQNIDRTNFLATISHLQRVVSLLSTTQENFDARALHATHWGRLCPVETPEGTPIGLRKNLALTTKISQEEVQDTKIKKQLEALGLELK
ncbi:MAG TPA: DNA-directed RNA polymerase subunit B'' [Candidatus Nanoarchaeia archaeon]|nr:DNA-directed RNA polymerase subunit B'' [Candidatus Nanoarchaeia archaeon]